MQNFKFEGQSFNFLKPKPQSDLFLFNLIEKTLSFAKHSKSKNAKLLIGQNYLIYSSVFSPKFPKRTFQTTKRSSNVGRPLNPILTEKLSNPLDVNTNVQNNVLVYKFNRELLCKGAFFLGMVCMLGLLSMADNVYRVYIKQQNKALPLKDRLIKFAIPATAVFIGLTCGEFQSAT